MSSVICTFCTRLIDKTITPLGCYNCFGMFCSHKCCSSHLKKCNKCGSRHCDPMNQHSEIPCLHYDEELQTVDSHIVNRRQTK